MSKQSLAPSKLDTTVSTLLSSRTRHETILFIILFFMIISLTPLLTFWGVNAGLALVIGLLVAPIVVILFVRFPMLGLYFVAISAFAIESDPLTTHIGTDNLYVFFWSPQMAGFIERPIGLVMLLSLFIWVFHRLIKHQPLLRGGALIGPLAFYLLCVLGTVVHGIATGGDQKIIIVQVRPFWYTFLSYILAYNFVIRKSDVRTFFWLSIVCAGFKGLQGLYVYLVLFHGHLAGHDTIMSHE